MGVGIEIINPEPSPGSPGTCWEVAGQGWWLQQEPGWVVLSGSGAVGQPGLLGLLLTLCLAVGPGGGSGLESAGTDSDRGAAPGLFSQGPSLQPPIQTLPGKPHTCPSLTACWTLRP